ncbi:MAG: peptide deformylase, peptide deformylase [Parcubacteria group bacterium]|nr:peptide deformylase, peptide deformylase [Parcubacteria group bacterium]
MKTTILQKDEPVLRKTAEAVKEAEFGTKELLHTIEKMRTALHSEDDGVAIAAPQIGISKRIFLVSGRTLGTLKSGKGYEEFEEEDALPDLIFINPEIQKLSRKKMLVEEGCLSVRWLYGKVSRAEKARVRARDKNGKTFTVDSSGLLAQIFQHETDHLNGILFIDKATDLEDLPPKTYAKQKD